MNALHKTEDRLQELAQQIRERRSVLDDVAQQLRTPAILDAFDEWNGDSWCLAVTGDALVRLRLLVEQNFRVLETIGVVAAARYIFELTLWLRLFAIDRRYGLVYFDQFLDTQERYLRDTLAQNEREVTWLKSLAEKETAAHKSAVDRIAVGSTREADVGGLLREVSGEIDAEAARRFSIHAAKAKTNGYSFQAYLVEAKIVPPLKKQLAEIKVQREQFKSRAASLVADIRPENWRWKQMAEKVGRGYEYDYLYSFASKLIHATPFSITSDQKCLEDAEMELFLKFIIVTIDDAVSLAVEYVPGRVAG